MNYLKRVYKYAFWMKDETFFSWDPAKVYNKVAKQGNYDGIIDYEKRVASLKQALKYIHQKPKNVLDLASGTGAVIDALPPSTNITAVDISKEMLAISKKRFKERKNITFIHKSFTDVTFPKNSFDLITISYATRFIPKENQQAFIQNITKWLKPGGVFMAVLMDSPIGTVTYYTGKLTGLPKGNNGELNYAKSFISYMSSYLSYKNTVALPQQAPLYKPMAIFFNKQ